MTTEPALLAQLQSLWEQAVPVSLAASPDRQNTSRSESESTAGDEWDEYFKPPDDDSVLYCGWWVSRVDYQPMTGRRRALEPCAWCGCRMRHSRLCVALRDGWAVVMPFGKHKGEPVRDIDHDYLRWVLRCGMELGDELRREVECVLDIFPSAT